VLDDLINLLRRQERPVPTRQLVEPRQQPDSRLAITIEDRLRLDPLHTKPFATRTRVPAHLNAYTS
jgi:hypothetical protein